jgi:hypothetical protein
MPKKLKRLKKLKELEIPTPDLWGSKGRLESKRSSNAPVRGTETCAEVEG